MRSVKERQFILAVHKTISISASPSTEVRTIYDITIIGASQLAYTFVTSDIGSQHTAEKEGAREGGRYNRTTGCYWNDRLPNGNRFLKRTHWFFNGCAMFNKKTYYCQQVGHDCFLTHIESLVHNRWHICSCGSIFVWCLIRYEQRWLSRPVTCCNYSFCAYKAVLKSWSKLK